MKKRAGGFTMIELLIAVALTATIVGASVFAFTTATRIWRAASDSADAIHHGDYIMGQIVSALRSAYYPDTAKPSAQHGMVLTSDGEDEEAHDILSWVKFGSALVGRKSGLADSPHRIMLYTLGEGESDDERYAEGGLFIKAWRLSAQVEDFDPEDEEYVKPRLLMPEVLALDFQVLDPEDNLAKGQAPKPLQEDFEGQGGLKWIDGEEWKDDYTNRLPYSVMATLYLKPTEKGQEPIALRRVVKLPTAPLSWRDKGASGGNEGTSGSDSRRENRSGDGGNANQKREGNGGRVNGGGGRGGEARPGGAGNGGNGGGPGGNTGRGFRRETAR